ncbi:MAG: HAD-IB family phosphatase [Candidatus Thermoplasmatota archaeon]|nr:HAD-IB family phosphatase [Candidatus Thermoplasmatota archaeon]
MTKLVVFDMDGVLADVDSSWVFVHRKFGVNNDHSLHAYLRGEIDDREFIRRDIELWREKDPGITREVIRKMLDDAPLMNGAEETVSTLKEAGHRTVIVSAGIDLLSERICQQLDMDMQFANGLGTDAHDRLSGEGILRVRLMDKGNTVTETARRLGIGQKDIVSVGNSRYDVTMFEASSLGIAFSPEDEEVRARADIVVEGRDLRRILDHIDDVR